MIAVFRILMIALVCKQFLWLHNCMYVALALAVYTDSGVNMANMAISVSCGLTLNIGSVLDLCNSPAHCKVASYITRFHYK